MSTVHNFKVKDIAGKKVALEDYKGKVLLIVNTASECGLTPQFSDLEEITKDYKGKDFAVLGFPSNQFGGQEPLNGAKISEFCEINYGVTFKIFDKVEVKGDDAIPLFKYLSKKSENGNYSSSPKWNFHKYLVNKNGEAVDYFLPITKANGSKVRKSIDKLLAE